MDSDFVSLNLTSDQNLKTMPNKPLPMNKLRTIIRLYTERVGLRAIAELYRTSRNTVKKYVNK